MTQVPIRDLLDKATLALVGQGFSRDQARAMADEFVSADLIGTKTHGLGKLISLNFGNVAAIPTINGTPPLLLINGNGGSGFIVMRAAAEKAAEICDAHGVVLAFIRNHSRYSSLYPYTELLARQGYVALLCNNAGPPATAPYGGIDPITGTNPICISVPTDEGVQTFDFATSEVVWGEIRQAALEGRELANNAFYDTEGEITRSPADVNSVKAFGGAKGWALNLAIEIMCGNLAGAKSGPNITSEFECGAMLLAVDPRATNPNASLPTAVSELLRSVRESRPASGFPAVRAPGDRARGGWLASSHLDDLLDVPEATLTLLDLLAAGEDVSQLSSNPLFN